MSLTALVASPDNAAVEVLTGILQELGIRTEQRDGIAPAADRLAMTSFDAALLDCSNEASALRLMANIRRAEHTRSVLIVALVDGSNHVKQMFAAGANFVIYKPISQERAVASLRAARAVMLREKRRGKRVRLHTKTSIAYATVDNARATLLDLGEHGAAIQADSSLPPRCKVYFQFTLPGEVSDVRLSAEVAWQDSCGRVGVRFADVPQASRRILADWVQANLAYVPTRNREITASSPETPVVAENPRGDLGPENMSSGDRRAKVRHTCQIGAEVYRVGRTVPNYCNLTDISMDGCYVETTSTWQVGAPLEIVVRTDTAKMRVLGKVRSVHTGFGMGVKFSLRNADQREQVEQLMASLASAEQTV